MIKTHSDALAELLRAGVVIEFTSIPTPYGPIFAKVKAIPPVEPRDVDDELTQVSQGSAPTFPVEMTFQIADSAEMLYALCYLITFLGRKGKPDETAKR